MQDHHGKAEVPYTQNMEYKLDVWERTKRLWLVNFDNRVISSSCCLFDSAAGQDCAFKYCMTWRSCNYYYKGIKDNYVFPNLSSHGVGLNHTAASTLNFFDEYGLTQVHSDAMFNIHVLLHVLQHNMVIIPNSEWEWEKRELYSTWSLK